MLLASFLGALLAMSSVSGQAPSKPADRSGEDSVSQPMDDQVPAEPCVVSTGRTDPRMASFDRMMCAFVSENHVPGAALAVTDGGRLVYARGFGYADVEAEQQVTPTSLFRIASVSKPITAVAILQLVQAARLHLDDRVFEILKYEPFLPEGASRDPRLDRVAIRQLLEHRGGWDRDRSFDPMFRSVPFANMLGVRPPAEPEHIIRCMLGTPLDFDPGERYAYSNFGYCLLGRVIEAVSGQTYERYVQEHVLAPLGIRSMRIGETRLKGRAENEVRYYDSGCGRSVFADDLNEPTPRPYGAWYLEAMDAHGGWIASAVDLARFAAAFDDPANCKVLSAESIRTMYERPAGTADIESGGTPDPVYYSCGWSNRVLAGGKRNHWHAGALAGTASLLVRRHDGRNWVVLCNAGSGNGGERLSSLIDPLVHRAAGEVEQWPEYDLFAGE